MKKMSKTHSQEMKELYNTGQVIRGNYTHCENKNEDCIHRRGCLRWIGNYKQSVIGGLDLSSLVDETKCIPNHKDKECENNFQFLDRFRLSNGEPFKKDEM